MITLTLTQEEVRYLAEWLTLEADTAWEREADPNADSSNPSLDAAAKTFSDALNVDDPINMEVSTETLGHALEVINWRLGVIDGFLADDDDYADEIALLPALSQKLDDADSDPPCEGCGTETIVRPMKGDHLCPDCRSAI